MKNRRMSSLPPCSSVLAGAIRQEEIKKMQTEKVGVKVNILADDMLLYIKDTKDQEKFHN